jgi:predicted transposase/invertase (TIGR01784 family)
MYVPLLMRDSAAEIEQRGREQGKDENKKEIACNMLKLGYSKKVITKLTGLTIDQVNKLKAAPSV